MVIIIIITITVSGAIIACPTSFIYIILCEKKTIDYCCGSFNTVFLPPSTVLSTYCVPMSMFLVYGLVV